MCHCYQCDGPLIHESARTCPGCKRVFCDGCCPKGVACCVCFEAALQEAWDNFRHTPAYRVRKAMASQPSPN